MARLPGERAEPARDRVRVGEDVGRVVLGAPVDEGAQPRREPVAEVAAHPVVVEEAALDPGLGEEADALGVVLARDVGAREVLGGRPRQEARPALDVAPERERRQRGTRSRRPRPTPPPRRGRAGHAARRPAGRRAAGGTRASGSGSRRGSPRRPPRRGRSPARRRPGAAPASARGRSAASAAPAAAAKARASASVSAQATGFSA